MSSIAAPSNEQNGVIPADVRTYSKWTQLPQ